MKSHDIPAKSHYNPIQSHYIPIKNSSNIPINMWIESLKHIVETGWNIGVLHI